MANYHQLKIPTDCSEIKIVAGEKRMRDYLILSMRMHNLHTYPIQLKQFERSIAWSVHFNIIYSVLRLWLLIFKPIIEIKKRKNQLELIKFLLLCCLLCVRYLSVVFDSFSTNSYLMRDEKSNKFDFDETNYSVSLTDFGSNCLFNTLNGLDIVWEASVKICIA